MSKCVAASMCLKKIEATLNSEDLFTLISVYNRKGLMGQ